jgi:hypothetical protein
VEFCERVWRGTAGGEFDVRHCVKRTFRRVGWEATFARVQLHMRKLKPAALDHRPSSSSDL